LLLVNISRKSNGEVKPWIRWLLALAGTAVSGGIAGLAVWTFATESQTATMRVTLGVHSDRFRQMDELGGHPVAIERLRNLSRNTAKEFADMRVEIDALKKDLDFFREIP